MTHSSVTAPALVVREYRAVRPLWIVDDATGCWVWQLYVNDLGYGVIQRQSIGGRKPAHRWVYEQMVGPIREGLQLDHLCRNRACCNPAHLEPVTRKENILRGESPAARGARATHCERGHEFTPENTYVNAATGKKRCRECKRQADRRHRAREKAAKS